MGHVLWATILTQAHTLMNSNLEFRRILRACSHRFQKVLYIERQNEAVAIVAKAVMEGAKGDCLTTLVAEAGRHGRITGIAATDRIPQQVLSNVSGFTLQGIHIRMCPGILMYEKEDKENLSIRLEVL